MFFQPDPIFHFLTLLNSLFYLKSISALKCWLDHSPRHLIAPVNTLNVPQRHASLSYGRFSIKSSEQSRLRITAGVP